MRDLAPNTVTTYSRIIRRTGLSIPASPDTVAAYVRKLTKSGRSKSTVRVHLNALSEQHHELGFSLDLRHPLILRAVASANGSRAKREAWAMPVGKLEPRNYMMMALLAREKMLRSEIVGLDWGRVGDGKGFVIIRQRGVEIVYLKWRATADPFPASKVITHSPFRRAAEQWYQEQGPKDGDPVFVNQSKFKMGQRLTDHGLYFIAKALSLKSNSNS